MMEQNERKMIVKMD